MFDPVSIIMCQGIATATLAQTESSTMVEIISDNFVFMTLGVLGFAGIVFGTLSSMVKNVTRERSRREIAAYIAEGSMTPADGERLMRAGPKED